MMRKFGALFGAFVVGSMAWMGAGSAAAEPQLPRVMLYSENLGSFGDHAFCHGAYNIGLVAPKGKRGTVRLTLTSFGFTGSGSAWARDPHCRFKVQVSYNASSGLGKYFYVPVSFGPRPGQRVVRDVYTGSGPAHIGVGSVSSNNVAALQSYGTSIITVVP
ncbi:enoyl-CoA hydratase [Gordonia sp. CPCC 205515]|uniref:enoyl-CoA hydratase n=1 Tax=Gordonia sp. CPCC 205515 TaxID=3140791 RepID=UPI003AF3538C